MRKARPGQRPVQPIELSRIAPGPAQSSRLTGRSVAFLPASQKMDCSCCSLLRQATSLAARRVGGGEVFVVVGGESEGTSRCRCRRAGDGQAPKGGLRRHLRLACLRTDVQTARARVSNTALGCTRALPPQEKDSPSQRSVEGVWDGYSTASMTYKKAYDAADFPQTIL